ncbi:MAG TPA: prepilin-type N-terminal cleavage/methylation domain-containing protein [Candidatus Paceibacterota bacterium]
MKNKITKISGFSLIEVIVYLALFGILMAGAFTAAYSLLESANRGNAAIIMQEEGNFLLAKINWALSSISEVNSPTLDTSSQNLLVTSINPGVGSIEIELSGDNIVLTRGGITETLNNTNIKASNMLFTYGSNDYVEWLTSSFTLNTMTLDGKAISQNFKSTKYLKK